MELKKIIHISDIHVRINDRHTEYREVFDRLYSYISNIDDSVVVLTGDIVHDKLSIASELVDVVYDFLFNLAKIKPTICIPGNHDLNVKNMDRYNPLSVIINAINKSSEHKIHYLFNNENLILDTVNFVHIPFFETSYSKLLIDDKINIALYHGDIGGCLYDNGMESKSDIKLDIFDGFDYVLLGDIHKRQFIKPNIAYAGSLIQQNFKESIDGHGGIIWDITNKTTEVFDIHNDYGFYHIDCNVDDKFIYSIKQKAKVKINHDSNDYEMALKLKDIISSNGVNYNNIELNDITSKSNILTTKINKDKVSDLEFQIDIIKNILCDVDENILDSIIELHKKSYNSIDIKHKIKHNIKINKMWFSNMFSYREDNYIDFKKYKNKILGILGDNASGKSSILDILTFALYDTTRRTVKSSEVMNNQSNDMSVKIEFDIDGEFYYIERIGKRKKNGDVSVSVDFYTKNQNLNGDKRASTNKIIQDYFGTIDTFLLNTFISQKGASGFTDLTQSERKDLLISFLDLNMFETIKSNIDVEIKSIINEIKNITNIDIDELVDNYTSTIKLNNIDIDDLVFKQKEITDKSYDIKHTISSLESRVVDIKDITYDYDDIVLKLENTNEQIKKLEDLDYSIRIADNQKNIDIIDSYLVEHEDKYKTYCDFLNEHSDTELKITSCKKDISSNKKLISEYESYITDYSDYSYDLDCKYCVENNDKYFNEVTKRKTKISELKRENYVLDQSLIALEGIFEEYTLKLEYANEYNSKIDDRNDYNKTIIGLYKNLEEKNSKVYNLKKKTQELTDMIDEYNKNKNDILNNKKINEDIYSYKIELKKYNLELDDLEYKITKLKDETNSLKYKIEDLTSKKQKLTQLIFKKDVYSNYSFLLSRNGIPLYILNNFISSFNIEINSILKDILPFKMEMVMENSNIDYYLIYKDKYINSKLASGMESFFIDISTRLALFNLSNGSFLNMLMIDEGFGVLDNKNIPKIPILFEFLRNNYDNVFIISHLDSIKDYTDLFLYVTKIDSFSTIN